MTIHEFQAMEASRIRRVSYARPAARVAGDWAGYAPAWGFLAPNGGVNGGRCRLLSTIFGVEGLVRRQGASRPFWNFAGSEIVFWSFRHAHPPDWFAGYTM